MVTAMRVVGNEEGRGGKAMTIATRVEGKWTGTVGTLKDGYIHNVPLHL